MEKIKHITSINQEIIPENTADNYKIQYIDISSVSQTGKIEHMEQYTFKEAPSRARRKVKYGDTIISTVRTYLKAISRIENREKNLICSTGFAVLTPKRIESKFLYYSCLSIYFIDEVCARSVGVSYPATTANEIGNISIPLPAISTQRAIATFLDKKTEAIDALIDKKQKLITLLEEQRVALINQAVTKGLDPAVPLKDSGVEWIGRIPAHWEVTKLKWTIRSLDQGWSPQCDSKPATIDEWGVLKAGCVNTFQFNPNESKALPDNLTPRPEITISKNDILISRANTTNLVGLAAIVTKDYPKLMMSDKLYRIKTTQSFTPKYLTIALRNVTTRIQIESDASGSSSSMQNVSQDKIKNWLIPSPPLAEQEAIAAYLDKELERQDAIIEKTRATIEKLTEYRQALITAAVTGQLHIGEPDAKDGSPRGEPTDEGADASSQLKLC